MNKCKLTIIPALEESEESVSFSFDSIEEARHASNCIADLLLYLQDGIGVMPDY